jgi:hypothetical protein
MITGPLPEKELKEIVAAKFKAFGLKISNRAVFTGKTFYFGLFSSDYLLHCRNEFGDFLCL